MKWSLNLGKYAGIKVQMHWSFLLLVAWIIMADVARGKDIAAITGSVLFLLAIFACIVLHEFGHALAARRYNINTHDITLLPIGGVARLERMPDEPRKELVIASAGPLVNVVIAGILAAVVFISGRGLVLATEDIQVITTGNFTQMLIGVNILLVLFNLIPAFPMDGGRIFRALLSMKLDHLKATRIASVMGRAIAVLFFILGLFYNPFLILIGLFVFLGAQYEYKMVQSKSVLEGYQVKDVMMSQLSLLKTTDTLDMAARRLLTGQETEFLVADNGHVDGIVTKTDIISGLEEKGKHAAVAEIMNKKFKSVKPDQPVTEVFNRMQMNESGILPVVDSNGSLVGALNMQNIMEFIMMNSAIRLREAG